MTDFNGCYLVILGFNIANIKFLLILLMLL